MVRVVGLLCCTLALVVFRAAPVHGANHSLIAQPLFWELEQLARIVDIAYCVGTAGLGIQKPFRCASHCADRDFSSFELLSAWNTGPFLSDSCGYIALSHAPGAQRIILAFRGTYSIANTIADLSTIPQEYIPYPGDDDDGGGGDREPPPGGQDPPVQPPRCTNCTVHSGFYSSWLHTRKVVLPFVTDALDKYPDYKLVLVGHSLGGAVAALGGLDFLARGWKPHVTTFGEPRLGNANLVSYIDKRFNTTADHASNTLRRVTHTGDPVPLLPLEEWGFAMHSDEIYISEPSLPVSIADVHYCNGDEDPHCIAGSDDERPSWGVPTRFKFWQLFFAHRDYFWRLGLCLPGGDPKDWYSKYPKHSSGDEEDVQEIVEL